ncbi:MAG: hypothetical protein WC464_06165 [Bdellovibrionales bacterium]
MSGISATDIEGIVGPDTGIAGHVAGLDIHYDISKADPKISGSSVVVDLNLNEGSLKRAEKVTGVSRTPKHGPKSTVSAATAKHGEKADNAYAGMFSKRGLLSAVGLGARPNYRAIMNSTPIGPLARVKQRRMLQLRRAFDQIAAAKTKTVAVNPENLPKAAIKKIVEAAINNGSTMTPVGSVARAMKLAGVAPKGGMKNVKAKKRDWAMLFPNGYIME